jgi:5-methylcytosine-specific restriction endonuclease McrA
LKRRGLIASCQKCGYSEHPEILGVHHKNKNRHDNKMENLIVLCPNCHSIEHARSIVHSVGK